MTGVVGGDNITLDSLSLELTTPNTQETTTITFVAGSLNTTHTITIRPQPTAFYTPQYTTNITVVEATPFDLLFIPSHIPYHGTFTLKYSGTAVLTGPTTTPVTSRTIFASLFLTASGSGDSGILTVNLDRSDGVVVTNTYQLTVYPPPPVTFKASGGVQCMAGVPFKVQPTYTMYADAAGDVPVANYTATAVISLTLSQATYVYSVGNLTSPFRSVLGVLGGCNNGSDHIVTTSDGVFTMEGLWIDRPGYFEVSAKLEVSGSVFTAVEGFHCQPAPTYDPPIGSKINSLTTIMFYNELPFTSEGLVYISDTEYCDTQLTSHVAYPASPPPPDTIYNSTLETASIYNELLAVADNTTKGYYWIVNLGFYAFDWSPASYVCLEVDWQPGWGVALWQHYVQRQDENYPLHFTFPILPESTCAAMSVSDALQYQEADPPLTWTTVRAGRRYGCKQTPPVNGAIPPCSCPATYTCSDFIAVQGTLQVNIGVCQCCSTWFLALMWGTGGLLFLAFSYMLLFKI